VNVYDFFASLNYSNKIAGFLDPNLRPKRPITKTSIVPRCSTSLFTLIFINPGVLTPCLISPIGHHNILSPQRTAVVGYLTGFVVSPKPHKILWKWYWPIYFISKSLVMCSSDLSNFHLAKFNIPPTSSPFNNWFSQIYYSLLDADFLHGQITIRFRKQKYDGTGTRRKGRAGHDFKFLVRSIWIDLAVYWVVGLKNIGIRKLPSNLLEDLYSSLKIDKSNSPNRCFNQHLPKRPLTLLRKMISNFPLKYAVGFTLKYKNPVIIKPWYQLPMAILI